MAHRDEPAPPVSPAPAWLKAAKRTVATIAVLGLLLTIALASAWKSVFTYVPPGKVLVIISKTGKEPPPGQLLAKPGEKGIQEEVLGEGRYFVTPVMNEIEIADAIEIAYNQVGVVRANVGKDLPPGKILADDGE